MVAWLHPKALVEVRSDDEGFRGVWYEASVFRLFRRRRVDVQYTTLLSDKDPSKPLRESVRSSHVRPRPPVPLKDAGGFGVFDLVEVFHNDGWWRGVVKSVTEEEGKEIYRVTFPTSREEIVLKGEGEMMRPQMDWVMGEWVRSGMGQEAKHPVFTVSSIVQVSRNRASFGTSWFAAQIKKVICNNIFLVEYRNIKVDGSDNELLTEIIDIQYIRPLQMLDSCVDFMVEDAVEVLLDGGWCSGVVVQILEGSNYRVKLDHSQEEKEFNKSTVRGGCQWDGFEWVPVSKGKSKKSGPRVKFTVNEQGPFADKNSFTPLSVAASSDESGATYESNSSLSKRKKVEGPSPGDQIETLNSSNWEATKLVKFNKRSQSGSSAELLKDHGVKSRKTNKKPRKMKSLKNDKIPSEFVDAHLMRNFSDVPEAPLKGELLQNDSSDRSVHLCEDHQTKDLTFSPLEGQRNSKGGYHPSTNNKTEVKALADDEHTATMIMNGSSEGHMNGLKNSEEPTTMINDCENDRQVDGLLNKEYSAKALIQHNEESGLKNSEEPTAVINDCEDDREVDGSLNKKDNAKALIPHNEESGHVGSKFITNTKVTELPFSKDSPFWESIESMEVFKKIPQQPHFQPLKQYAPEFREGMAIGLMISFANFVSSVHKLQVHEAQSAIREKFEALVPLKKNGFNVQCLHQRLQKLLEFQTCQEEFESKKSSLTEKILGKNEDNAELNISIMAVDKSISEIEEKLKQLYEERDSLYSQRKRNDSEIHKLQEDLSKAEEVYSSAERVLGSFLAA